MLLAAQQPAPSCDSARLARPTSLVRDTLRLRMRPSAALPSLPHPWAELVLDEIASRLRIGTVTLPVFEPVPLDPPKPLNPPPLPAFVATLFDEVRVTLAPGGHGKVELVSRSLSDDVDLALLRALERADSAAALPMPPGATTPGATPPVFFISLARAGAPPELRGTPGELSRDVAVLSLPRFEGVAPAMPVEGTPGPVYPVAERMARREGKATVSFIVDRSGAVAPGTVHIEDFTAPTFASAVLDFTRTVRFRPATIGGCAVRQLVAQTFEFLLHPPLPVAVPTP